MPKPPGGEVPPGYWNTMIAVIVALAVVMVIVVLVAAGIFLGILKW